MDARMNLSIVLFLVVVISGCTSGPNIRPDYVPDAPVQEEVTEGGEPPSSEAHTEDASEEQFPVEEQPTEQVPSSLWRSNLANCKNDPVTFTVSPMDPDVITEIEPLGKTHGGHVTPTDHLYIKDISGYSTKGTYDVFAPADGFITSMERHTDRLAPGVDDYWISIWYSCTVSTIYIHTVDLPDDIKAAAGPFDQSSYDPNHYNWYPSQGYPAIPVTAGHVIGKSTGSFDFSVQDTTVRLAGFVDPRWYGEEWKIHTVDPLPYFTENIRQQWLAKIPRTIQPLGGKIDYDINGRLVGNWFLGSLADYTAARDWRNDLAIVYDHFDPTQIRINVGAETGISDEACSICQRAYGVKGNAPDPADVSPATGMVKYELVPWKSTGVSRQISNDESTILGVFLVQMLGDRKIKIEVFPGKSASQVSGFTAKAQIYNR